MKRLAPESYESFFTHGYAVVDDLVPAEKLDALATEITELLDAVTEHLWTEGRITDRRETEPFETRLTRLLDDHPELQGEYLRAIEGKGGGGFTGKAIYDILTEPALLDAMEDLVGPELVASSVYRIRPKVPGLARGVVPWHQDSGYIAPHCDGSMIVTCWIPLIDATVENGCLCVLPNVHKSGVVRHHTGGNAGYLVIKDDDLPSGEAVPVPVKRGGVLLMTNMTPHCSTVNHTDVIRWSIDLRYQSREVPNNLAVNTPEDIAIDHPDIHIACYAPEGDFVVRSIKDPVTVATHSEFARRRNLFESARISSPSLNRGWQPA
ncbi:MAG: phytanoyl-CoA dioxygenase family protein [Armatimonas sp.]